MDSVIDLSMQLLKNAGLQWQHLCVCPKNKSEIEHVVIP